MVPAWEGGIVNVRSAGMMVEPAVDLKFLCRIGEGGCGRVYLVEDRDGGKLALKRFDESAVNFGLLDQMTRRLAAGGWPPGVLPVIRAHGGADPGTRLVRVLADFPNGAQEPLPRSLQHQLDTHPGGGSWMLVKSIARALADMHERGVAHGNLKPGNVFMDSGGEVVLTDWTLGNMPGIRAFQFTDALLYQPPEQLRNPAGYSSAAGFRWDVFAFGVLSYRLLTGMFPRCHSVYSQVAPVPGETRRQDLHVDLMKVARNLESHALLPWPDSGPGSQEPGLRECIDRCLSLDPANRPADMAIVSADLRRIELATRDSSVDEAAEPLWSHIHPIRPTGLDASKEDRILSERDLWDFDEEMDWIGSAGFRAPELSVAAGSADGERDLLDDRNAGAMREWEDSFDHEALSDAAVEEARPEIPVIEEASQAGVGPIASEREAAGWLEGEAADWEPPSVSRRKSRGRGRVAAPVAASSPPEVRRSRRWTVTDYFGVTLLAASVVACAWAVFAHSILKLPEKRDNFQTPAFPIAGERIQLESVVAYWRPPVTEGPRVDTCRRGTFLLPVLEIAVTGGSSMIRVQFRNEEGKTTGDPLIRAVRPGDIVKLAGTAGLEDSAAWAAYRLGGESQWSVQIHEIPSAQPSGGESKELLRMDLPGCLH